MKIEGTIGDEEVAAAMRKREGWILIMPELETGVPQANEIIRWLIGSVVPYFVVISTHLWHYGYS
jgi:CCR4-NOT transcriptional complex subunit CAF120